jgi:hypothetical protein
MRSIKYGHQARNAFIHGGITRSFVGEDVGGLDLLQRRRPFTLDSKDNGKISAFSCFVKEAIIN